MFFRAILSLGILGFAMNGFGHGRPSTFKDESKRDESQPTAVIVKDFKPSEFPFVTTIPDDGTDKGGGYQVAKVNLEFQHIVLPVKVVIWYCPFNVDMPLRTELKGVISPTQSATMSAAVANSVAAGMDYNLPQGMFCEQFILRMRASFPVMYPGFGGTAMK